MRKWIVGLLIALLVVAVPASAQGPSVMDYACSPADVTLVTTAETLIISSNVTRTPRDEAEIIVIGYAQLTTGTNTTGVTARIRRGAAVGGTLVNEANVEQVKAAAGSTEPMIAIAIEQRPTAAIQYSLTLAQTAASANGSSLQACILVLAR